MTEFEKLFGEHEKVYLGRIGVDATTSKGAGIQVGSSMFGPPEVVYAMLDTLLEGIGADKRMPPGMKAAAESALVLVHDAADADFDGLGGKLRAKKGLRAGG